jgi:RNA polymerase sigma-70 factor (ECF subfamily)
MFGTGRHQTAPSAKDDGMADSPQRRLPTAETATSRSLLLQVKDGQPAAWERLTALYAPLVYQWCRGMHLAEQDMPDVFQEVFRSVASHIQDFHTDRPGDSFRHWLRAITRNKVRDHFRRQSRQAQAAGGTDAQIYFSQLVAPGADLEGAEGGEAHDEEGEIRQLLRGALEQVREQVHPQTWQAFWKVVVEGKTPEEAGAELAMRPGTVRVAKSRVLSRLRSELGDLIF